MLTEIRLKSSDKVVLLSGAGLSAESGIKTFRDVNGLWRNHRIEEVACYDAFLQNPSLVWEFYKLRYQQLKKVRPNPAHYAVARLEKASKNLQIITQNVDDLLDRAGCKRVYNMHGWLNRCFCVDCGANYDMKEVNLNKDIPLCPKCSGYLRPDIVWFGEMPYFMKEIYTALESVDYFLVVGTSGVVYPAAGLLSAAKQQGAHTIGVNLQKPANLNYIDEFYKGKAGEILPVLIDDILEKLQ